MNERRFGEQEIEMILQRAVQLEALNRIPAGSEAHGLTLAEIREIALEAGIDPILVERAAWELEAHRLRDEHGRGGWSDGGLHPSLPQA